MSSLITDALKNLVIALKGSSYCQKADAFEAVHVLLLNEKIPDIALKSLFKYFGGSIIFYGSKKEKNLLRKLLIKIVKVQATDVLKYLPLLTTDMLKLFDVSCLTNSLHKEVLFISKLIVALIEECYESLKKDDITSSQLQSILLVLARFSNVAFTGSKYFDNFKKLIYKFTKLPQLLSTTVTMFATLEPVANYVAFLALLLSSMNEEQKKELLVGKEEALLGHFTRTCLLVKTRPAEHVLHAASRKGGFLRTLISHELFAQHVLPSVQKAVLRSPEMALNAIFAILDAELTIDLSHYANDLVKPLASQLLTQSEEVRAAAGQACAALSRHCTDPSAQMAVLQHLCDILNGKEGKLILLDRKHSVILAIGNLASSSSTLGSAQATRQLASFAIEKLCAFSDQEVHEGTLVHLYNQLCHWCSRVSSAQVPLTLIEWFKNSISNLKLPSGVRLAILQCVAATFSKNDSLYLATSLVPKLIDLVKRACKQAAQVALLAEATFAISLLLRMATNLAELDNGTLDTLWPLLLPKDRERRFFWSHRFLCQAPSAALQALLSVVEQLLIEHVSQVNADNIDCLHNTALMCLVHRDWSVRCTARQIAERLMRSLAGNKVQLALLHQFQQLLDQQLTVDNQATSLVKSVEADSSGEPSTASMSYNAVPSWLLCECLSLLVLAAVSNQTIVERRSLAQACLLIAHHPNVVVFKSDLWMKFVDKLHLSDDQTFAQQYWTHIQTEMFNCGEISQSQIAAAITLTKWRPEIVLPNLLPTLRDTLLSEGILSVSRHDVEIFNTPSGMLYDISIMESAIQYRDEQANVKRESKAYSFREQQAEAELRRELEAKRRAKMGQTAAEVDDPHRPKLDKLAPKHRELVEQKLAEEASVRSTLTIVCRRLKSQLALLHDVLIIDDYNFRKAAQAYLLDMSLCILRLLSAPLAAPYVLPIYVDVVVVALQDDRPTNCVSHYQHGQFELIAWSALRQHAVEMHLSGTLQGKSWMVEDDISQAARAIHILGGLCATEQLSDWSLALLLPLIRAPLSCSNDWPSDIVTAVLDLILQQSKALSSGKPLVLPCAQLVSLLLMFPSISTASIQLQQGARRTLLGLIELVGRAEFQSQSNLLSTIAEGTRQSNMTIREVALEALIILAEARPQLLMKDKGFADVRLRVWIARHDPETSVQNLAQRIWNTAGLQWDLPDHPSDLLTGTVMLENISSSVECIQTAAVEAFAAALQIYPDRTSSALTALYDMYKLRLKRQPPVFDDFGRIVKPASPDCWEARLGVSCAFRRLSAELTEDQIVELFEFLVPLGLSDPDKRVRDSMLTAASTAVEAHGKKCLPRLLPILENFLNQAPDNAELDSVRQSIVILTGSLAKHLEKDDPKVRSIFARLLETLSFPSQAVQEAVANMLPPLMPAVRDDASRVVKNLMTLLLESSNFGERVGAAYGLAGVVKGLGILSLKQLDIMSVLLEAVQDKKNPRHREGALLAFHHLCRMLGRLFEPYVVTLLPHLLLGFGDSNNHVREAAEDTARAVMSRLSAHGVKLVLPSLLCALQEESWRTKCGSVELLGAMAFCAPKQLSACLPQIVPRLTEVLTDSHIKVQRAGCQALQQIGSVIKNPEVQAIVPVLLEALQDPSARTTHCFTVLLNMQFVHLVDAASLALLMPVIQRGFDDRGTETRKMAALIMGNMYSLTDQRDLQPYLPGVIPGLKRCLLDPAPHVRSVAARALGAMVKGLGEECFQELFPWLMETLISENSSVNRSGAAQGLAEMLGGLGETKLADIMPEIVETTQRSDLQPHVRDGYIMLYIYLPGVFQQQFAPYVSIILPAVLQALSDETEFVRDSGLRAGQRIVQLYSNQAIEILLPQLEEGMFDDNWRIRHSSVQLLGDLLYKLSGVSGKGTSETASEEDTLGSEAGQASILQLLGQERRDRVLSGLYMSRSDTALLVRQAAVHVWKVIVAHTPRTLREMLPTLFNLLLGCLASASYDKRQVAARTLGDLVRKLGERVLPDIIPILERGLDSPRDDQRQGVCVGLNEIMKSSSRDAVIAYSEQLMPAVRRALCDRQGSVREAGAQTFAQLHGVVGVRALEEILAPLLAIICNAKETSGKRINESADKDDDDDDAKICGGESAGEHAMDGLRQVLLVRSAAVLPFLVPKLTTPPVNTRALAFLSAVAGDSLTRHLSKILPALINSLSNVIGDEEQEVLRLKECETVVLSVTQEGVRHLVDELVATAGGSNTSGALVNGPCEKTAALLLLQKLVARGKADMRPFHGQLLRISLRQFAQFEDNRLLHAAWDLLSAAVERLAPREQLEEVSSLRQAVHYTLMDFPANQDLPGFCLPKKGIVPILTIYREGILNGTPEQKESCAIGLGEVIRHTSCDALAPSVVSIAGPLIRILGDRFSFSIKAALLDTLTVLLQKSSIKMRPFLPQLQTTFLKALHDSHRQVRLKAAAALGLLSSIHVKPDSLVSELLTLISVGATDANFEQRDTSLQALRNVLESAGPKLKDEVRRDAANRLMPLMTTSDEEATQSAASACVGLLCSLGTPDENNVLLDQILNEKAPIACGTGNTIEILWAHSRLIALTVALRFGAHAILNPSHRAAVLDSVIKGCGSDRVPVCSAALRALSYLLGHVASSPQAQTQDELANCFSALQKCIRKENNDLKLLTVLLCSHVARRSSAEPRLLARDLVPLLVNGTREKNNAVRSASEQALADLLRLHLNRDEADYRLTDCLELVHPNMHDVLLKLAKKSWPQNELPPEMDNSVLK